MKIQFLARNSLGFYNLLNNWKIASGKDYLKEMLGDKKKALQCRKLLQISRLSVE